MRFILAFISLLATVLCKPVYPSQPSRAERGRILGAATRRSILKRSDDISTCLKNKAELFYAESYNNEGEKNYAAKVTVTSDKRILVLEELEHLLDELICAPASITLSIPSFGDAAVIETLRELQDGHIITSHSRCNADFERQAYSVLDVTVVDASLIIFSVVPVPFRTAFRTIEVEMGYTYESHELRSIGSIARRDMPTVSTVSLNKISLIDKPIWREPGDFPIEISCKNCSLWGEIDLESANFQWGCGDDLDDLSDCISGTATATAKGMGGIVELEASVENSWGKEIPLLPPDLHPSTSIDILNIGTGIFQYGPFLDIGYDFEGHIDMVYGFDMQVPDGAKVWLDVGDLSKSGADGFERTKVNTIPFQSSAKIQTLGIHAALRSKILVSFNLNMVAEFEGSVKAAVHVDTPLLKAQITPVKDVNVNCQQVSSGSGSHVVNDAIHIDLTSDFDFGYSLGGSISFMGDSDKFKPLTAAKNITKPMKLANMCLVFDEQTQSYESAVQAVSNTAIVLAARAPAMMFMLCLSAALFVIL